ncbi:lysosomal protective protein-like [Patella vulgata]|uniref:lysosomal protective protein-like n=1 Tax=Patella vulgata TaxID=6465 RepID=UPI00217FAD2F|nr:lysosomal protective protein-like [Patella vulgata]
MNSFVKSAALLLLATVGVLEAAVAQDEINYMPGLAKQPNFKQYSGYLKASGTKKLHYWFVESVGNPAKDPLVLWMNGGPGCSSVLGLLTEHGPFRINPDGKTVVYNPYSWNLLANMLYLEAPAGVGFSYSDDKNYTTNDDEVAQNNFLALKDFFSKYPEYSKNEFYVTGESYGGVYVPTLSALVVDDKEINFQGMAIGNGLSSYDLNDNSLIYFAYYHGLYDEVIWDSLVQNCCNGNATGRCMFTKAVSNQKCKEAVTTASQIVYSSGLNVYNLYGECAGGVQKTSVRFDAQRNKVVSNNFGWLLSNTDYIKKEFELLKTLAPGSLSLDPPCINATNVAKYLNSPEGRQALHIPEQVQPWTTCSGEVSANYVSTYMEMSAQYKKILAAKKRVLVYNGDVDMACNFLGDEWFIEDLDLDVVAERMEWFYMAADGTKQVAGFVKQFEDLDLVTVRGSGHMVPTDRPIAALRMFSNYLTIRQ